ncbi:occludin/ELL family protein [Synechococcus sp. CS-1324]|uniref:occludin/ELL family protein n=1 Tax=unclassified Synechococcus TaxID=2626047 RepID=UPI0021A5020E|nr:MULTISPECIES: occludin/ELL family protein [unclassified Synechococcus]MCT0212367.1 occludin/ELL family protein [Synechococcus sp. CS-1326]MCT0231250.1 occludin/ELL family protein [Synechococcus sp. CS-1324]
MPKLFGIDRQLPGMGPIFSLRQLQPLPAGLRLLPLLAGAMAITCLPALAAPVICTTTLEAPPQGGRFGTAGPVEVTRCGVVETTEALVERRAFTYRSSFARGVSLTHQFTDILGIAMGGSDGNTVMGLGFPDQAILWDSSAIQNTTSALLEEQSAPIPWRSGDLPNQFTSSLQSGPESTAVPIAQVDGYRPSGGMQGLPRREFIPGDAPIRGLW